jgi:hypothetical protein
MLDPLLLAAREKLEKELVDKPQLQKRNVHQTARIISEGVIEALTQRLLSGDDSVVQEILSGQETVANSPLISNLLPVVSTYLAPHLGISNGEARNMAKMAIPLVLDALNGRIARARQRGLDVSELTRGADAQLTGSRQEHYNRVRNQLENLLRP